MYGHFLPSLLVLFLLLLLLFSFGFSCCVSDMLYCFLRVLGFGAHCFAVLLLCSCFSWSLRTSSNEKVKKNTLFFCFVLGCFLHHLEEICPFSFLLFFLAGIRDSVFLLLWDVGNGVFE
jgi:hypothetical protein